MEPLDKIVISDLLLRCIIGIYDHERKHTQDVLVNITLFADLRVSCESDNIDDTINYKDVSKKIIHMTEKSSFNLVEALAQKISSLCLEDELVKGCRVMVQKPGALRFSKTVGVEIERWKK
ncbi:MAG: dihydroneopterin aldolase [Nitrospinota bacterium]